MDAETRQPWIEPEIARLDIGDTAALIGIGADGGNIGFPDDTRS